MAVSNTNVALRSEIGNDGCKVVETANISLSSLMTGGNINGILNTYAGSNSGPVSGFEKIGGSNNPLASSPNTSVTTSHRVAILNTPHHMSHAIGGFHEAGGGPGQ